MPYAPFEEGKPVISDSGQDVVDKTRINVEAARDAVIMGTFREYDMTVTVGGGSAAEPDSIEWLESVSADRVRATLTWSGGAPTVIVWAFSVDGLVYDTIGTQTITYSGDNPTSSAWT